MLAKQGLPKFFDTKASRFLAVTLAYQVRRNEASIRPFLQDENPVVRAATLMLLASSPSLTPSDYLSLGDSMWRDPAPLVRAVAVVVYSYEFHAEIGDAVRERLTLLAANTKEHALVRTEAVWQLSHALETGRHEKAARAVADALRAKDPGLRAVAAEALSDSAWIPPEDLAVLLAVLAREGEEGKSTLGPINFPILSVHDPRVVRKARIPTSTLLAWMDSADLTLRDHALHMLTLADQISLDLLPALNHADKDARRRLPDPDYVIPALLSLGKPAANHLAWIRRELVASIESVTEKTYPRSRRALEQLVRSIDVAALPTEEVEALLADKDPDVADSALRELWRRQEGLPLAKALAVAQPRVRLATAYLLRHRETEAPRIARALEGLEVPEDLEYELKALLRALPKLDEAGERRLLTTYVKTGDSIWFEALDARSASASLLRDSVWQRTLTSSSRNTATQLMLQWDALAPRLIEHFKMAGSEERTRVVSMLERVKTWFKNSRSTDLVAMIDNLDAEDPLRPRLQALTTPHDPNTPTDPVSFTPYGWEE